MRIIRDREKHSFNITHPEKKPGEFFLTNATTQDIQHMQGYKSQRVGKIAYDMNGNRLSFFLPVFVNKKEYQRRNEDERPWPMKEFN